MKNDRVEELQDISNEFLRRLGEDEDDINLNKQTLKTEVNSDANTLFNRRKINMPNFSLSRLYKKGNEKKVSLVINNTIYNN